ncbi:hypothetical protein K440DRAFT_149512 [Wilcoxina mikolae CBS 423.85]|nr:hypothetical protein K440DRAFT_149512 [Wilcoxina mikolae CBS 423.85]
MDNLQPQPPHHLTPALACLHLVLPVPLTVPDCDTSLLMLVLFSPAYSRIDVQYRLHLELPASPPSRPLSLDALLCVCYLDTLPLSELSSRPLRSTVRSPCDHLLLPAS